MCLPKRCERLKTYFIIILSSTCAPVVAAAAPSPVSAHFLLALWSAALIRVCRLDENIRVHLRLYLMAVIVHGRLAVSNTRHIYVICSRPTATSAVSSSSLSSIIFLICLVRRWIFPIILAFPSVKFIRHIVRRGCKWYCDTTKGASRRNRQRTREWIVLCCCCCCLLGVLCIVGVRTKKYNNNNHIARSPDRGVMLLAILIEISV